MTDVVELLRDLIRFDTTNPPGNESACIAYVQRLCSSEAGIETRIVAKDDARPNLIARVRGAARRRRSSSTATSTSSPPPASSGRTRRSRASSSTAGSGAAARST